MSAQVTIEDLNAIYGALGSLREARALLSDRVRGTNDRLNDLCKEYELSIINGERALTNLRKVYSGV